MDKSPGYHLIYTLSFRSSSPSVPVLDFCRCIASFPAFILQPLFEWCLHFQNPAPTYVVTISRERKAKSTGWLNCLGRGVNTFCLLRASSRKMEVALCSTRLRSISVVSGKEDRNWLAMCSLHTGTQRDYISTEIPFLSERAEGRNTIIRNLGGSFVNRCDG